MTTYPFGQPVQLNAGTPDAPIVDDSGTPTDPATLVLTVRRPDGVDDVFNAGALTRVGVGVYHYVYPPAQAGRYRYRYVSTAPDGAAEGDFDVEESLFGGGAAALFVPPAPYGRVARTAGAVLEHTFYVGETGIDATGTVTVAITDAVGGSVSSGNATATGGAGRYTYTLPAQSALKLLQVRWTATIGGVAVVETDVVEVVGGFLFGLAEGRASDDSLADVEKYPLRKLIAARQEVEEELEHICDRAFASRYARVVVDGTGNSELVLGHPLPDRSARDVTAIRSVSMAGRVDRTFTAFTADELAALTVAADGTLRREDGAVWTEGRQTVRVEYEYGQAGAPAELRKAAMQRLRSRLNLTRSGVPDRAESFTATDGGTYRLSLPDRYRTGLPEVDAVYGRYSMRPGAGTGKDDTGSGRPASRTLTYEPQRWSMFHGRRV